MEYDYDPFDGKRSRLTRDQIKLGALVRVLECKFYPRTERGGFDTLVYNFALGEIIEVHDADFLVEVIFSVQTREGKKSMLTVSFFSLTEEPKEFTYTLFYLCTSEELQKACANQEQLLNQAGETLQKYKEVRDRLASHSK